MFAFSGHLILHLLRSHVTGLFDRRATLGRFRTRWLPQRTALFPSSSRVLSLAYVSAHHAWVERSARLLTGLV